MEKKIFLIIFHLIFFSLCQKKDLKDSKKDDVPKYKKLLFLQKLFFSPKNNNYYTTLYLGENQIPQTYMIDTRASVLSSPCAPSKNTGKHKKNYFNADKKNPLEELKCDDNMCKLVTSNCNSKDKDDNNKCSFSSKESNGDGVNGYYVKDIIFFECDKNYTSLSEKKLKSHTIPLGCSSEEQGMYKSMYADGVMGVNNDNNSFISLLYNSNIINQNLFTLCLAPDGGYMSIGDIDTTFHKFNIINYVPLMSSTNLYSIDVNEITIDSTNKLDGKYIATIDSSNIFTTFPTQLFNQAYEKFESFCTNKKSINTCGKFKLDKNNGYCTDFDTKEDMMKTISTFWPNIVLKLDNNLLFNWNSVNYFYDNSKDDKYSACLGIKEHKYENIILGSNFMKGHDFIFDKDNQKLGFVAADCAQTAEVLTVPENSKVQDSKPEKKRKNSKLEINDEMVLKRPKIKTNKKIDIIMIFFIIIALIILIAIVTYVIMNRIKTSKYERITDENAKTYYQGNNVIDEISDNNKVTNEEVEYLKNLMKITSK